jgi:hypothetical protein
MDRKENTASNRPSVVACVCFGLEVTATEPLPSNRHVQKRYSLAIVICAGFTILPSSRHDTTPFPQDSFLKAD